MKKDPLKKKTYSPQSSYAFVQTRSKDAIDIAEDGVGVFAIQLFPKEFDDCLELLRGTNLEHAVLEDRCRW